jgi:hypothetical protein
MRTLFKKVLLMRSYYIYWILFSLVDLYTTLSGVLYFGARELNPVVSLALDYGLVPFVIFKLMMIMLWIYLTRLIPEKIRDFTAWPSVIMIAMISLSNAYIILSI